MDFIGCTAKYLPNELAVPAAETACQQNPANRPGNGLSDVVLAPEHLALVTSKWWGSKGVHLTVAFMESISNELASRIVLYLNQWNKYANVEFVPSSTDPQVRITREGMGYWSFLGTDILHVPRNEPTMCFQGWTMSMPESEWTRVIPHEAGHSLGAPHEHMRRQIINRIDTQRAIAYFKQTQGWSPAMVMQQVLTPLAEASIMSTPDADENSIMTYSLPGSITKDGMPIIGGSRIEEQDIEFIGKMYPKVSVPPPPPLPPAGKGVSVRLDIESKRGYFSAPAGWRFDREPSTQGANMSVDKEQMAALATELDSCLGDVSVPVGAEAAGGAFGGIIAKGRELVAALRSGDALAALNAAYDLLGLILGRAGDGSVSFSTQAPAMGLNWSIFKEILKKLLPLLIGAL